jgi:hypothetical protein
MPWGKYVMMRDSLVEELERAARVTDPNPDDEDEAEPAEDERDIDDDEEEEDEVPDEPESEPAKPKPKRAGNPKAGPGPAAGDLGPNPAIPAPAGILPAAGDPAGDPGHLSVVIPSGNPATSFRVVSTHDDSIIFEYIATEPGERGRFSAVIPFERPGRYLLTLLRARMPAELGP